MIRVELAARSGEVPPLRSDTLYGLLVWAVRAVLGDDAARRLITPLLDEPPEPPLRLTSAFPVLGEDEDEGGASLFPGPIGGGGRFVDEAGLLGLVASGEIDAADVVAVESVVAARRRFFLADGPLEHFVEPAVSFLERFGFTGDASRGRGAFSVRVTDVRFPKLAGDGERALLLSVHHPSPDERRRLVERSEAGEDLRWGLEPRRGVCGGRLTTSPARLKPPVVVLREGSVVPAGVGRAPILGELAEEGGARWPIVYPGCGFFLPLGGGQAA